jgi:hypothetical protein
MQKEECAMIENTPIEIKIKELLLKIPQTWAAYRPDDLSQVESEALYLLTGAGLVERREGLRLQMLNNSITGEAVITVTGEYGLFESLEKFIAGMSLDWEESFKKWRSSKTSAVSPFHCQRTEPCEWRLTSSGVQELQSLQNGKLDWKTLLDFVLKRGFYDGKQRLVGGRVLQQMPVRGAGSLVSLRKVKDSCEKHPGTINIGNFGPNGEALSQVLMQLFGNMIDTKQAKGVGRPTPKNKKSVNKSIPGKSDEQPHDLVSLAVAVKHFCVSRVTLKRNIGEGKIKSYRPPKSKTNSQHLVSAKEIAAIYPRR